jgi:hypothetical protein
MTVVAAGCGFGSPKYSVAGLVEIRPDKSAELCYPVLPLAPGANCDFFVVPVKNIDVSKLPHDETLSDGSFRTPPLLLTGTLTDAGLTLTETPKRAAKITDIPRPDAPNAGTFPNTMPAKALRDQERLIADNAKLRAKGIWVAESGWTNAGFSVVLVTADQEKINYIKSNYSANAVAGWFKPTG